MEIAPTRCRQIWRNLADLVQDGEGLPEVKAHLQECSACTTLVARSRSMAHLLRSLPTAEAPARLDEGVWERLLAWDEGSGRTRRLGDLMAGLPRAAAPVELPAPTRVEDPRVAHLLGACRPVLAPAQLDALVSQSVRSFLWRRSRESRVLRFVVGSLAAAAALLLCAALWAPTTSPRPRLLFQEELAPPMGWETPESLQGRLHGLLDLQGLLDSRQGLHEAPGGRPRGR